MMLDAPPHHPSTGFLLALYHLLLTPPRPCTYTRCLWQAPWLKQQPRSSSLVELVDLAPTIAELAGIPIPQDETFDGTSMLPLLRGDAGIAVKPAAFSQYARAVRSAGEPWKSNNCIHTARDEFTHMGYTIRTEEWRYTEWVEWNGTALAPVWGSVAGRELYDHRNETVYPTDFNARENENLADEPAWAVVVEGLSKAVRAQFGNTTGP